MSAAIMMSYHSMDGKTRKCEMRQDKQWIIMSSNFEMPALTNLSSNDDHSKAMTIPLLSEVESSTASISSFTTSTDDNLFE